jgi:hypothetical protein
MPAAALYRESSVRAGLAILAEPVYPHWAFGSPTLAGSEDTGINCDQEIVVFLSTLGGRMCYAGLPVSPSGGGEDDDQA